MPHRFEFHITDESGEIIIADYCTIGKIDEFGSNEEIESLVARMLRSFKRTQREAALMRRDDEDFHAATEALDAFDRGDLETFRAMLAALNPYEKILYLLVAEAVDCARSGDLAEAAHRIRLYVSPKFASLSDCEVQYRRSLGGKRS